MIRNIVFDIGNVLIGFRPEDFLDKSGYSESEKGIILRDIFRSSEWQQIDSGDLSTEEAIERIAARSSMKRHEIASIFDLRMKIFYPIDGNIKLLPSLKERGFKLYFLSNFPSDIFDDVFNGYPFFNYFDGGLISARVKASKPDKKIFEILLEKYSLDPNECLFIDDIAVNVQTAIMVGMRGIYLSVPSELEVLIEKNLEPVL
jgi:FMN phosphatase YigB (HAD superfamily)